MPAGVPQAKAPISRLFTHNATVNHNFILILFNYDKPKRGKTVDATRSYIPGSYPRHEGPVVDMSAAGSGNLESPRGQLTKEYDMFDRFFPIPVSHAALSRAATLAGLAAGFLAVTTEAASAQTACLPRGKLVDLLGGRYSEQRVAVGLENSGRLFEVFAADDGSTWTMAVTTPDGASCVIAAGMEWQKPETEEFDPEM